MEPQCAPGDHGDSYRRDVAAIAGSHTGCRKDDIRDDMHAARMTSSPDPYTSRIVASPGESLGWHVKNWLANRISDVNRFRGASTACVDAVGPAGSQGRDGWSCE